MILQMAGIEMEGQPAQSISSRCGRSLPVPTAMSVKMRTRSGLWRAALALPCLLMGCDQSRGSENQSDGQGRATLLESRLDSVFSLTGDEVGLGATDPDLAAEQRHGDLALVDRRDQRVALYDSTGRPKAQIGRRGQGPGEFEDIEGVFSLPGDTVMIFDRTRQIGYLYHEYRATNTRVDFREWQFTANRSQVLLGRFADGRWVALVGQSRPLVNESVRVGTDSIHLIAGAPEAAPARIATIARVKQVDLVTSGYSYRFDLNEIAPGAGAICENGVMLADTTGVRFLSVAGKEVWSAAHPYSRSSIEGFGGIDGIVGRQLSDVVPGVLTEKARSALREMGQKVDSAMNPVLIDARGIVWYPRPGEQRGTAYALYADRQELPQRFLAPGAYRIGSRFLLSLSVDADLEVAKYTAFRVNPTINDSRTGLGWCYGQFRW